MHANIRPEDSYTNFYRVLKIHQVKYSVFLSSKKDERDQTLLEAELHLRNRYPMALFYQTNKELWTFGLNDLEVPVPLEKFNLTCKETNIFLPSIIFNTNANAPGDGRGKYSNILYTILLNSIKKKIMINLSVKNYLMPFGSGSIVNFTNQPTDTSTKFSELIFVDPQITSNGEVIISLSSKSCNLFNLSKYIALTNNVDIANSNFALYLAPSGIRAYFANGSFTESLTQTPSNSQNLLIMLQLLVGIVFNKKLGEIKWIKLIPDLKHLNGLTPQISKYLKPVQNHKFVIWPVDLCYVQKGQDFPGFTSSCELDPYDTLDDFMTLGKVSNKLSTLANQNSIPSTNIIIDSVSTNGPSEVFDTPKVPQPAKEDVPEKPQSVKETPSNNWSELNEELFGDNNEVTDADFNFFDNSPEHTDSQPKILVDEPEETQVMARSDSPLPEKKPPTFDIPKDEICLPPSPYIYNDPGAPLPISSSPRISSQSVFSPLKFNPVIRDVVDNKYDKGGKFYVPENELQPKGDTRKKHEDFSIVVPSSDEDLTSDSEPELPDDGRGNNDADNESDYSEIEEDVKADQNPHQVSKVTELGLLNDQSSIKMEESPTSDLESSQLNGYKSEQAGNVRYHDSSNWIPFLTKSIPLYTIPEHFFYTCPSIKESELASILGLMTNLIVYDDSLIDGHIVKNLGIKPECLKSLTELDGTAGIASTVSKDNFKDLEDTADDFEDYYEDSDDQSVESLAKENEESPIVIESAIKGLFDSIKKIQLREYIGLNDEAKEDLLETLITNNEQNNGFMYEDDYMGNNDNGASDLRLHFFTIKAPTCKIKRMNQEMSINSLGLKLWKILSLAPLYEKRNFKVLFIINEPSNQNLVDISKDLLHATIKIYESCGLGNIDPITPGKLKKMVNYQGLDDITKEIIESIDSGVFNLNYDGTNSKEYYAALSSKLLILGKLLSLSKHKFLFLFWNPVTDINSVIEITKAFANLESLFNENRPFYQIIPTEFFIVNGLYSPPSISRLVKHSLTLYNCCSSNNNKLYSNLSKTLPTKINFQLTSSPIAKKLLSEDLYIHLAYDRSVDKNWCVASWTDQWGRSKKIKSWYCYPIGSQSKNNEGNGVRKTFEQVANEMWKITQETISNHLGNAYLILTRLNGVILDDELPHWKRLSHNSDLVIIFLTVNTNPRLILDEVKCSYPFNKLFLHKNSTPKMKKRVDANFAKDHTTPDGNQSPSSPPFTTGPEFVNKESSGENHELTLSELENGDLYYNDIKILDLSQEFYGVILKNSIPLSNFVNKITFKTGYIIKPLKDSKDEKMLALETNLLSYPSTFESRDLLQILLGQLRNLVTVNYLIGNYSQSNTNNSYKEDTEDTHNLNSINYNFESIIPWHILAVKKVMNVLYHIRVEQ